MSLENGSFDAQAWSEKAQQLFDMCDTEQKGFIIKRDMQRMQQELSVLSPDQLEEVFDSLDQDGNGFLTPEEFTRGFGAFLGLQVDIVDADEDGEVTAGPITEQASSADEICRASDQEAAVNKDEFYQWIDKLGAGDSPILKNQESVAKLYSNLRQDDSNLLVNFEDFLSKISTDLKKSKDEFHALEKAMKQKSSCHDQEVKQLYEEMEAQIRAEKEKAAAEERQRAIEERQRMEREMMEKDQQLQDILKRHTELERKVSVIDGTKAITLREQEELMNERDEFQKEKEATEREMEELKLSLDESKDSLNQIKKQQRDEKRERAKSALRVTESIASERENMVQELFSLRTINKRLQDEKEEMQAKLETGPRRPHVEDRMDSMTAATEATLAAANIAAKAAQDRAVSTRAFRNVASATILHNSEDVEVDEDLLQQEDSLPSSPNSSFRAPSVIEQRPSSLVNSNYVGVGSLAAELARADSSMTPQQSFDAVRTQPVGGNESFGAVSGFEETDATPDRIFKVVFVGDSGVGKTCFQHRFCHNSFKPTFSATIGVDFTVKTLSIGDRVVALQLWDTAGQERFRSITKQYFRKADGVCLLYDLTSESSFLNMRNWIQSVKEGVDDNCVLCIIGNKLDMVGEIRTLKAKDGESLAEEYDSLFFEASAQTGQGVFEAMKAMAFLLQEKEDQHIEEALKLDQIGDVKKKKCCGK